jgi:hypothetical protein
MALFSHGVKDLQPDDPHKKAHSYPSLLSISSINIPGHQEKLLPSFLNSERR